MKSNIPLLILIALFSSFSLYSQNNSDNSEKVFDNAEKIFSEIYNDGKDESMSFSKSGYAAIIPVFLELSVKDPSNMNLAFKLGVCYLSSIKERVKAIPNFSKAITAATDNYSGSSYKERNAPLISYKFLGDAYHLNNEFDKAIDAYNKFIMIMKENKESGKLLIAETNRRIEMCKTGKILVASPVRIRIENLGNNVNSAYADYSPVLSADQATLFFTSRRSETTGGQKDADGNNMEDIYMSDRTKDGWAKATNIGSRINTEWHEATVGTSPDGQMILIYKDDKGDGNIYSTSLEGDTWSTPVKLNDNINTKHWEPSAFISADGNTLYFTSDRPDGFGGRDLYTSKRTTDGDWGKALNMGPNINTKYDEDAPFIHHDSRALSFSSNGHNTMGGFDVFTSLLSEEGVWSQPVNAGYPINTADDDIFYVFTPDDRKAYLSSYRDGGFGEKDNYLVTFLDRKETPLTLMKGVVKDESGMAAKKVMITVTDNETGEITGSYHTNSKTGQFLFILSPGKNYNITYQAENHLFFSENLEIPQKSNYYEINRSVLLDPIVVGSRITLNNIFFDFDKSTLRILSNVELKNLVLLLKGNPNLKVEISGHTDSKGDNAYNQKLSEERAQAVVANLIANGISADRMKAKGYGKTEPVSANKKSNGKDDPKGRQANRRVELLITEIN
jgi:outer membrane protein OmpA-like peptidoglycan-associated protein/tetratricopeptide (TPR) repeat protein